MAVVAMTSIDFVIILALTMFCTLGAALFLLCMIWLYIDTDTPMDSRKWRAFGTGDYDAAEKCANETPVEKLPYDEVTKEYEVKEWN